MHTKFTRTHNTMIRSLYDDDTLIEDVIDGNESTEFEQF